jgi:polysaccharide biosynthesis/export protein
MPLIGAVPARGATTAALQQAIAARLRQGYIREPHVAVEVEAYRPFFILGEVTLPGQYPYVPNMSVETAVAIAGGYTPRAFKYRIEVSRPVNGMIERKVVSATYPVRPGDTINISERWF